MNQQNHHKAFAAFSARYVLGIAAPQIALPGRAALVRSFLLVPWRWWWHSDESLVDDGLVWLVEPG